MIDYRILPEHRLIVVCFWGSTDEQEVLALSTALRSDPLFSNEYDALVDNTHLEHTVSADELRELAKPRVLDMGSKTRLAVIAPSDLTYGVSRMHQMLSESRTSQLVEVFRDRLSALEWLGKTGLDVERTCEELRSLCRRS